MTTIEPILTSEMIADIKQLFSCYPSRQAVTLPALHIVHERLRCVPLQAVVEIAKLLDLAPAEVQDTLTFYGFFHQEKPHGETRVWVCRSISCHLRGADDLLDHVCSRAGISAGETTEDGLLTVEAAECLGACEFAPCLLANEQLHKSMRSEDADRLLDSITNS